VEAATGLGCGEARGSGMFVRASSCVYLVH